MNIPLTLKYLARVAYSRYNDYLYTPPSGGFINHDETEWDAIVWTDPDQSKFPWFMVEGNYPPAVVWFADDRMAIEGVNALQNGKVLGRDGSGNLTSVTVSSTAKSFANPTRTSGTAFQISTTRDAQVSYSAAISSAATLVVGSAAIMTLQYADNSGMSTNVVTLPPDAFGVPTGLVSSVNSTLKTGGIIPAGKYVRVTVTSTLGTPTIGAISAQEVLI